MSARNYLSVRDKNKLECLPTCLPSITQKFGYRSGQGLPPLSASTSTPLNRNLSYKYDIQPFFVNQDQGDRAGSGTPFSDFNSDSEIGTPDILSEESDSSAGSALRQSTAEATRALVEEWERIERTLYDEAGDKCLRPAMIEECKQWKELHPQLRIIGKALQLPEKKAGFRQIEYDEVIAMQYSDYDTFSESEERLSQSSTDITPVNSPRPSICDNLSERRCRISISEETFDTKNLSEKRYQTSISEETYQPKLSREKVTFYPTFDHEELVPDNSKFNREDHLPDRFCSLLHITPLTIQSPPQKKRPPSILRSEIASSRWMRNRPDSSTHYERNSAKSFVSLDTRAYKNALSASERNKIYNNRVLTAKNKDLTRLQSLYPDIPQHEMNPYFTNSYQNHYSVRKVSLPPLLLEEDRKNSAHGSAKKHKSKKHSIPTSGYNWDKRSNY